MKKRLWQLFKVVFGLGLIGYLLFSIDLPEMWSEMKNGALIWLLPAALSIAVLLLFLAPLKLYPLLQRAGKFRFSDVYRASAIGLFFNNVLPSSVGGDAVKVLVLKRRSNVSWAALVTASLADRLIGLGILLLAALVYLLFKPMESNLRLFENASGGMPVELIWIVFSSLLLFILIFRKKIKAFLRQMIEAASKYDLRSLTLAVFFAILFQGLRVISLYFYLRFYDYRIALPDLLFVISVVSVVSMIPISVGALGVRENILTWSLALYGVPLSASVGLALISRVIFVLLSLIGAIYYFQEGKLQKTEEDDSV